MSKKQSSRYEAVVIGTSSGGLNALKTILTSLDKNFKLPILVVQHMSPSSDSYITVYLNKLCKVKVKEADEKEKIKGGIVYFAPPNFHMLVEENHTISLSVEAKVNYARPSIDVLFETTAYAYKDRLVGIVLTGANHDGSEGLLKIKEFGGYTIVQNPKSAEADIMPISAINKTKPHKIYKLDEIASFLNKISNI